MQEQPRVIGYLQADALSDNDLRYISGGISKLSVTPTQKLSGHLPGPVDITIDQDWD